MKIRIGYDFWGREERSCYLRHSSQIWFKFCLGAILVLGSVPWTAKPSHGVITEFGEWMSEWRDQKNRDQKNRGSLEQPAKTTLTQRFGVITDCARAGAFLSVGCNQAIQGQNSRTLDTYHWWSHLKKVFKKGQNPKMCPDIFFSCSNIYSCVLIIPFAALPRIKCTMRASSENP